MNRVNQEAVTTFAEVLSTVGVSYHQQSRPATTDKRPVVHFQGMKVYIPDGFQPETLLKLLQVMRQL
ncbi:MAG: hypothetical protein HFG22_17265 [Lachnospiraceae bacterium]|nr:hypothetical protein [Lachnospiraceae bacterium]